MHAGPCPLPTTTTRPRSSLSSARLTCTCRRSSLCRRAQMDRGAHPRGRPGGSDRTGLGSGSSPCGVLLLLQCHDMCGRADAVSSSVHAVGTLVVVATDLPPCLHACLRRRSSRGLGAAALWTKGSRLGTDVVDVGSAQQRFSPPQWLRRRAARRLLRCQVRAHAQAAWASCVAGWGRCRCCCVCLHLSSSPHSSPLLPPLLQSSTASACTSPLVLSSLLHSSASHCEWMRGAAAPFSAWPRSRASSTSVATRRRPTSARRR